MHAKPYAVVVNIDNIKSLNLREELNKEADRWVRTCYLKDRAQRFVACTLRGPVEDE